MLTSVNNNYFLFDIQNLVYLSQNIFLCIKMVNKAKFAYEIKLSCVKLSTELKYFKLLKQKAKFGKDMQGNNIRVKGMQNLYLNMNLHVACTL